ncbi:MAG TPA: type II toxin-antitoxin system RelE/ParE family toxin [Flavobacteriales bacterium]|nr:type II toxin-antitoxin system RelE/ParE family toxin [Flavobacteriales bacterium]
MGKPVVWSPVGIESFEAVVGRIRRNWTQREVDDFIRKVDQTIQLIAAWPKAFRKSSTRGHREALIAPYNLLVYREFKEKVVIELIWDGRRHPRSKGVSLRRTRSDRKRPGPST